MPVSERPTIAADTNVDWLLEHTAAVVPVFVRRRLQCVGCPVARFETLSDVCDIYGLQLDEFLAELRMTAAAAEPTKPSCH